MGNKKKNNRIDNDIKRKIEELQRITGLSLYMDLSEGEDEKSGNPDEDISYVLHQLTALIDSYKERNSKEAIYKRWITGDMETHELIHTAKRLHVPLSSRRALFLIETKDTLDSSAAAILKHAFPDTSHVWLVPMSSRQMAMLYTFAENEPEDLLHSTAYLVMDLLNAEALIQVKVSYSAIREHLNQLPDAYQEASLALNVGKIFYPDQNIYPHDQLGIGRLIYGLSPERCQAYLQEVLGTDSSSFFQPETVHVINCFLDNNLNIAETTRRLHMHRNTLIYRLEQIQKETGLDIRQFHDAMTIKTVLFVTNYMNHMALL